MSSDSSSNYLETSQQAVFFGEKSDFYISLKQSYFEANYRSLIKEIEVGCGDLAILEIGPGYGEVAGFLKERFKVKSYLSVDNNRSVVEHNLKLGHQSELSDDLARWLESKGAQFNLILMIDVLEHIPLEQAKAVLSALYKRLEKNGRLIIQVPNMGAPFGGNIGYGDTTHHLLLNEHGFGQLLKESGIKRFEIKPYRLPAGSLRMLQSITRELFFKFVTFFQYLCGVIRCNIMTPNLVIVITK